MSNVKVIFAVLIAITVQIVNLSAAPAVDSLTRVSVPLEGQMRGGIKIIYTGAKVKANSGLELEATLTLTTSAGEIAEEWILPASSFEEFVLNVPVGTYFLTVTSEALAEPIIKVIRVK